MEQMIKTFRQHSCRGELDEVDPDLTQCLSERGVRFQVQGTTVYPDVERHLVHEAAARSQHECWGLYLCETGDGISRRKEYWVALYPNGYEAASAPAAFLGVVGGKTPDRDVFSFLQREIEAWNEGPQTPETTPLLDAVGKILHLVWRKEHRPINRASGAMVAPWTWETPIECPTWGTIWLVGGPVYPLGIRVQEILCEACA